MGQVSPIKEVRYDRGGPKKEGPDPNSSEVTSLEKILNFEDPETNTYLFRAYWSRRNAMER